MTINEVREIVQLLPKFIQMVENDLGEEQHVIEGDPITYGEFERICTLTDKLNTCIQFVDVSIFESKQRVRRGGTK